MNQPNYVLRFDEAALKRRKESIAVKIFRISVLVIIAILVLGSLIIRENLFSEFSWSTRCLLIVIAIAAFCLGRRQEDVPSPVELQFYDDYLILYRPKRFYSKRVTRMEINKMMYADITRFVFKAKLLRVHIYGRLHATWYNYDANDRISESPTYDRVVDDTLCFVRVLFATDIDFKKEVEEHSPIQVIVENG